MPAALDDLMQTASQALADLDYARCEALCVEVLALARDESDWVMYQRVLMPLQETRRQRRQEALDGQVLLGLSGQLSDATSRVLEIEQGCMVLTWPATADEAITASEAVRSTKKPIELLFADNAPEAETWRITSFTGPRLSVDLPAPKQAWIGSWIDPSAITPPTPAHWFMQASEALGDAALATIETVPCSLEYLLALEQALACVDDHEIIHQRLAAAAKALQEAKR